MVETNVRRVEKPIKVGETPIGKSLTVPFQSMSIPDIIRRSLSGEELNFHNVYYDGDDSEVDETCVDETLNPDFDLDDAERMSKKLDAEMKAKKKAADDKRSAKEKADLEAEIRQRIQSEVVNPPIE